MSTLPIQRQDRFLVPLTLDKIISLYLTEPALKLELNVFFLQLYACLNCAIDVKAKQVRLSQLLNKTQDGDLYSIPLFSC